MARRGSCRLALGEKQSGRNGHEMETVAESMDFFLKGNVTMGMSVLMQRFKSLELTSHDGNLERGRHLELVRIVKVSCVSTRELDLGRSTAVLERRLAPRKH